ncbi:MAG: YdcF family protein [Pelagimonas sp.]|jgi:uncharacterized SAM-binding protein YcdF (DUF218 family)|nr:YdcF family protein [Pelagimonas sp.]
MTLYAATLLLVAQWTHHWPITAPSKLPKSDAIVCLGSGVNLHGRLTPMSRQRSLTCVDLYKAGIAPVIAFSGRVGDDAFTEVAVQMAVLAREAGVPESALVIEPASASTLQNALFTLPLLERKTHLTVVTDSFHLPRSWLSFKLAGAERITLYPSQMKGQHLPLSWRPLLRESLAIWFNALRWPLHWSLAKTGVAPPNWLLR